MNIRIEKPQKASYWKPLIIVLVIAAGLLLWFWFAPQPSVPLAFEILGFEGDAQLYDLQSRSWRAPKRGEAFATSQKLKTGADGIINLQVENQIMLRLKENAELSNKESKSQGKKDIYKIHLEKGVLLGATTKEFERKLIFGKSVSFEVTTPHSIVTPSGAVFRILAGRGPNEDFVGVLRGSVELAPASFLFPKKGLRIRGLEMAGLIDGVVQTPKKVNAKEWQEMKESYELLVRSAALEAEQINLSKLAGSFFNVVFDHGTFFTPKIGYAGRDFFKDLDSGQVFLEAEYDVFPAGSFCGVYIKTRDFDISKYAGLSFEIRRKAEEGVPESFFIEFKSKGNVVRRFAPRNFQKDWTLVEFDFHAQKSIIVNEVVFVFTNARVGEAKKGMLEFRHINLIPLPKVTTPVPQEAAHAAMASQVQLLASQPVSSLAASQNVVPKPTTSVSKPPVDQLVSSSAASRSVASKAAIPVFKLPVNQPVPSSIAPQASASAADSSYSVPKEVSLE
ncbi:MAG: FecR family protein [Candidatus Omnitrophota bacterium]